MTVDYFADGLPNSRQRSRKGARDIVAPTNDNAMKDAKENVMMTSSIHSNSSNQSTANNSIMRQKELDREAERERERKREQEIRAFREFSTKLPLKQTLGGNSVATNPNNAGGMGTSRRSRESSFANDGLTPLQHAPVSLGPLQGNKVDNISGPNSLAPIVGNVPPLGNFGSLGKF